MHLSAIDHVVLYARDPDRLMAFYVEVLGMRAEVFDGDHRALHAEDFKINVHAADQAFEPHAASTSPGHLDICLTVAGPIEPVVDELTKRGVATIEGPGQQVGARGLMTSIYLNDPEGNLIELSSYDPQDG